MFFFVKCERIHWVRVWTNFCTRMTNMEMVTFNFQSFLTELVPFCWNGDELLKHLLESPIECCYTCYNLDCFYFVNNNSVTITKTKPKQWNLHPAAWKIPSPFELYYFVSAWRKHSFPFHSDPANLRSDNFCVSSTTPVLADTISCLRARLYPRPEQFWHCDPVFVEWFRPNSCVLLEQLLNESACPFTMTYCSNQLLIMDYLEKALCKPLAEIVALYMYDSVTIDLAIQKLARNVRLADGEDGCLLSYDPIAESFCLQMFTIEHTLNKIHVVRWVQNNEEWFQKVCDLMFPYRMLISAHYSNFVIKAFNGKRVLRPVAANMNPIPLSYYFDVDLSNYALHMLKFSNSDMYIKSLKFNL